MKNCSLKRAAIVMTLIVCSSYTCVSQQSASSRPSTDYSEGTVNVLLANGSTLVAETDSMLTSAGGLQHASGAVKLFEIDDHTIATMAGFYYYPGAHGFLPLAVRVPEIIKSFSDHQPSPMAGNDFSLKAYELFQELQFELTSNLQATIAANPRMDLRLVDLVEVTLAGIDHDGKLKIAELTLAPHKDATGVSFQGVLRPQTRSMPPCASTAIEEPQHEIPRSGKEGLQVFHVGPKLFCVVAGIPDPADDLLSNPTRFASEPAITAYIHSQTAGVPMTSQELSKLADGLVTYTTESEIREGSLRVGGLPQTATIYDGKAHGSFLPIRSTGDGTALAGGHGYDNQVTCSGAARGTPDFSPMGFANTLPQGYHQEQVRVEGCKYRLDKTVFHDSVFIDSVLVLTGNSEGFEFAPTNTVTNSILLIGPELKLSEPKVLSLLCAYKWKQIYHGTDPISFPCS